MWSSAIFAEMTRGGSLPKNNQAPAAAEKAIKALLCLSGVTPPRNHDFVHLIELLLPSLDLQRFLISQQGELTCHIENSDIPGKYRTGSRSGALCSPSREK